MQVLVECLERVLGRAQLEPPTGSNSAPLCKVRNSGSSLADQMVGMAATTALASLYFPAIMVLPLYLAQDLPRSHPRAVWTRMAITAFTSCALSWLPVYAEARSKARPGGSLPGRAGGPPHEPATGRPRLL